MIRLLGYPISKKKLALVGLDASLFWTGFLAVATMEYNARWALDYMRVFYLPLSLVCFTYVLVFYIGELYSVSKDYRSQKETLNIVLVCCSALLASTIMIFPNYSFQVSRKLFMYNGVFMATATVLSRYTLSKYLGRESNQTKTLLLGTTELARAILELTQRQPRLETRIVAAYEPSVFEEPQEMDGLPVLAARDTKLTDVVKQIGIRRVILATPLGSYNPVLGECFRLSFDGVELVPGEVWYEQYTGKVPVRFIDDSWLLSEEFNRPKFYYRKVKRLMDLIIASLGLIIGMPVMLGVALAIYLESGRPILFVQKRVGRLGNSFNILKFRTMVNDAEQKWPARATVPNDPRITRVGRIIRRIHLDELPQLINVWRGEMSIIGPRPEREVFVQKSQNLKPLEILGRRREDAGRKVMLDRSREALPYYSKRLLLQPGITGWAQVNYSYADSLEEREERLTYDLYYLKNMSFTLDCLILLRTVRVILLGRGAR